MKQIVDLEGSPDFRSLDVALVSIAVDPVADLSLAVSQYGITTPLLSDEERKVSESYGVTKRMAVDAPRMLLYSSRSPRIPCSGKSIRSGKSD